MSEKDEQKKFGIVAYGMGLAIVADLNDATAHRYLNVDWIRYSHATAIWAWDMTGVFYNLAHKGPTSSTSLTHVPHGIDIPVSAIDMIIHCSQDSVEQFTPAIEKAKKRFLKK